VRALTMAWPVAPCLPQARLAAAVGCAAEAPGKAAAHSMLTL